MEEFKIIFKKQYKLNEAFKINVELGKLKNEIYNSHDTKTWENSFGLFLKTRKIKATKK